MVQSKLPTHLPPGRRRRLGSSLIPPCLHIQPPTILNHHNPPLDLSDQNHTRRPTTPINLSHQKPILLTMPSSAMCPCNACFNAPDTPRPHVQGKSYVVSFHLPKGKHPFSAFQSMSKDSPRRTSIASDRVPLRFAGAASPYS